VPIHSAIVIASLIRLIWPSGFTTPAAGVPFQQAAANVGVFAARKQETAVFFDAAASHAVF